MRKSQGEIESDKMEQERGLFYEIDKGIGAMKKGHIMQHDEAMHESIINRIDQAIFESEQEMANGAETVDAEIVFAELEKRLR